VRQFTLFIAANGDQIAVDRIVSEHNGHDIPGEDYRIGSPSIFQKDKETGFALEFVACAHLSISDNLARAIQASRMLLFKYCTSDFIDGILRHANPRSAVSFSCCVFSEMETFHFDSVRLHMCELESGNNLPFSCRTLKIDFPCRPACWMSLCLSCDTLALEMRGNFITSDVFDHLRERKSPLSRLYISGTTLNGSLLDELCLLTRSVLSVSNCLFGKSSSSCHVTVATPIQRLLLDLAGIKEDDVTSLLERMKQVEEIQLPRIALGPRLLAALQHHESLTRLSIVRCSRVLRADAAPLNQVKSVHITSSQKKRIPSLRLWFPNADFLVL